MGDDECNDGGGGDTASKIGNTAHVYARFSLFSHLILVHVSN